MPVLLRFVPLTAAFALGTVAVGWWAVPVLGIAWGGVAQRDTRPVLTAAAAASFAWIVLLLWSATRGPVWELASKAGETVGVPGVVLVVAAVVFPAVVAAAAAWVVVAARRKPTP